MASAAQQEEVQKRAAIANQIADASKLAKYIQQWGGVAKLYAFMKAVGDANFGLIAADYFAEKLFSLYETLPKDIRIGALQKLAGLSQVSRQRVRDMYPHVDWKMGGYAANTSAQACVLKALCLNAALTHANGANLPLNVSGLLEYALRANQVYTVEPAANVAQKNYIFDGAGVCVAEVDFGNHGGDAVSGHCHVFGIPGAVAFAHHNLGGIHLGINEYPIGWQAVGVAVPQTAIGQ